MDAFFVKGLSFAGYDYRFAYFVGKGHSSRYCDRGEAYKRNEWLRKDYNDVPIAASANSPRVVRSKPSYLTHEGVRDKIGARKSTLQGECYDRDTEK